MFFVFVLAGKTYQRIRVPTKLKFATKTKVKPTKTTTKESVSEFGLTPQTTLRFPLTGFLS